MVGIRPVGGVRNPISSTSISSFVRAKNAGEALPEFGSEPHPGNLHQTVSPVRLLEAAPRILNEKEY
jgi:hypothetical protein